MVSPMLIEIGITILALGVLVFFLAGPLACGWAAIIAVAGLLIVVYGFVKDRQGKDR